MDTGAALSDPRFGVTALHFMPDAVKWIDGRGARRRAVLAAISCMIA
jgi:hypothetical protein